MDKTRVLIDWDGDGFSNKGVSIGTPPNLFPGAPYLGKSKLRALQFTSGSDLYEDHFEIFDYGLSYRTVEMGGSSTKGQYIRLGYSQPATWQPLSTDPVNLLEGSSRGVFPGIIYGNRDQNTDFFIRRIPLEEAVSKLGLTTTNRVGTHVYAGYGDQIAANHVYTFGYHSGSGITSPSSAPYFEDAPTNDYLKTTAAGTAVTWAGFTCLPSTTYTFVFSAKSKTASSTPLYIRVYAPSATLTTPNFGRNLLAKSDTTVTTTNWQTYSITFTTGASDTQFGVGIMYDYASGAGSTPTLLGGLMLLDGSVATPSRFWDSSLIHTDEQFAAILGADKDYTLSFWARTTTPLSTISMTGTCYTYELYTNNEAAEAVPDITDINGDWQRFNLYFPSRTYDRGFSVDWTTISLNGFPITNSYGGVLEFSGLMLCEGTTEWPYHAGELYDYDDLSSYALSVTTKSGRGKAEEVLAYEGVATIELNNSERLFSPENESSPLYNVFDQNRRIVIQILIDDEWETIWTGWTYQFDVAPGENRSNRATLTCQQGLFRMRESSFTAPQEQEVRIDPIVQRLVEDGGWRSPVSPYQSNLDYGIRLDENAFLSDPAMIFSRVDEGVNTIELVGQDWGRKTEPEAALKSLLESENASLWISRDGRMVLVNREFWVNQEVPVEVLIDSDTQEAEYSFGQGMVNHVEVSMNRKRAKTDETVWSTKRAFKVKPFKKAGDKTEIEIHAAHTEGRQKTVIRYTLEGMTKTVYLADPGISYRNLKTASSEQADKVKIELLPVGGKLYRLRITNNNPFFVWLDLELKGDYLDTEDGSTVIVEDSDSIANVTGLHTMSLSNSIVGSEQQARAMGMFHILRNAEAHGEFSSIEVRQDTTFFKNVTLGTKLLLTEQQTDEVSSVHFVIGEDVSIRGSNFTVTYTLMRGFPQDFMRLETTLPYEDHTIYQAGVDIAILEYAENFVTDQTNVGVYNGASVEIDGTSIIYSTGPAPNSLILDCSPGQVRYYLPGEALIPFAFGGATGVVAPWDKTTKFPSMVGDYYYQGVGVFSWEGDVDLTRGKAHLVKGAKYRLISHHPASSTGITTIRRTGSSSQLKNWGGIVDAASVATQSVDGAYHRVLDFIVPTATQTGIYGQGSYEQGPLSLVQYSKVKGTVANTYCHYHLYAQRVKGQPPLSYTLTLYNATTGNVIGSVAHTVGDVPVHFEINPGDIESRVYATFGKTVEDYVDHQVNILGYGYVPILHTISAPEDLHKESIAYKLYP